MIRKIKVNRILTKLFNDLFLFIMYWDERYYINSIDIIVIDHDKNKVTINTTELEEQYIGRYDENAHLFIKNHFKRYNHYKFCDADDKEIIFNYGKRNKT